MLHARHGEGSVPLRPVGSFATAHPAARRATASVARAKARRAQKRRRDVFFGLLAATIGSAALAMIPGFKVLWALNLTLDAVLRRPDVDARRVAVYGGSFGGYWATILAVTEKDRVRAVVVQSPPIHESVSG